MKKFMITSALLLTVAGTALAHKALKPDLGNSGSPGGVACEDDGTPITDIYTDETGDLWYYISGSWVEFTWNDIEKRYERTIGQTLYWVFLEDGTGQWDADFTSNLEISSGHLEVGDLS